MSGRLDSAGILHDAGWSEPRLALDHALNARKATTVLSVDKALKAAREQRTPSAMEKLIPGYDRLR